MPVKRVGGKAAFLAAVTRFGADLLTHHIAQHHQALFGAPIFCFMQVKVHQAMKDAHCRMALQLTIDIDLRHFGALLMFKYIGQIELSLRAGIFLHATAQIVRRASGCARC